MNKFIETLTIRFIVQMDCVSNGRGFVMVVRIVQMVQTRLKSCVLYTNLEPQVKIIAIPMTFIINYLCKN